MSEAVSVLSLAKKAGKLVSGSFQTSESIRMSDALLVIIATDASRNTKNRFSGQCTLKRIEFIEAFDRRTLGQAIGKDWISVVALTDENFKKLFLSKFR